MLSDPVAVEIREGKIFIGGVDQGLERDDTEHMRLTARGLRKSHTVYLIDEKRYQDRRLIGIGTIEGTIGLVGQSHKVREVEVIIQAAPADRADLDWHTFIGASFADGEITDEDSWAVQIRIPGDVWKRLEYDYDAEHVREIDLTVQAPLWCKRTPFFHQNRPALMLTPDRNGSGGAVQGKTTAITWRDGPRVATEASALPEDMVAPVAGPPTVSARLVSTVTWCLPAIVALLAFIAVRG